MMGRRAGGDAGGVVRRGFVGRIGPERRRYVWRRSDMLELKEVVEDVGGAIDNDDVGLRRIYHE